MHNAKDILGSTLAGQSAQNSMDGAKRRVAQVEGRIRSQCLGFLELHTPQTVPLHQVNPFRQPTIHLVHRTLLDFLSHGEILDSLKEQTNGTGFDAYLNLFASSLWMAKTCPSLNTTRGGKDGASPWVPIQSTLLMAYNAEIS
jgi:hypothetical protein